MYKTTFVNEGKASATAVAIIKVSDYNLVGLKIELLKLSSSKYLVMKFLIDEDPPEGFADAIIAVSKRNAVMCTVEVADNVQVKCVAEIMKEAGISKVRIMESMMKKVGEVEF